MAAEIVEVLVGVVRWVIQRSEYALAGFFRSGDPARPGGVPPELRVRFPLAGDQRVARAVRDVGDTDLAVVIEGAVSFALAGREDRGGAGGVLAVIDIDRAEDGDVV